MESKTPGREAGERGSQEPKGAGVVKVEQLEEENHTERVAGPGIPAAATTEKAGCAMDIANSPPLMPA